MMDESLMETALKKICVGKIRDHIDLHESTKSYPEIRNEVIVFAMKKKGEAKDNKPTTETGMDLSAVMRQLKSEHENYNREWPMCGGDGKVCEPYPRGAFEPWQMNVDEPESNSEEAELKSWIMALMKVAVKAKEKVKEHYRLDTIAVK